jgi:NADH dehydrogenase
VELSGALAELCKETLKSEFRNIDITATEILLIEAATKLLSTFHHESSDYAEQTLKKLGVRVLLQTFVRDINDAAITVEEDGKSREIKVDVVIWAAGVKPTLIADLLKRRAMAELYKDGRVKVEPDLSLAKYGEIFVLGDLAYVEDQKGQPLPGLAPVAIQQGAFVVRPVLDRIRGQASTPFRYSDRGIMAVIGRGRAVAEVGLLRLKGLFAWKVWAIIHIYFLIGFENKLIVFTHWIWNYVTHSRSSRLIIENEK